MAASFPEAARCRSAASATALDAANTYTGATIAAGENNDLLQHAENVGVSARWGTSPANNPGSIILGGGYLEYSSVNQNDYSGRFSTAANQCYNANTDSQNVIWATPLVSSGGSCWARPGRECCRSLAPIRSPAP